MTELVGNRMAGNKCWLSSSITLCGSFIKKLTNSLTSNLTSIYKINYWKTLDFSVLFLAMTFSEKGPIILTFKGKHFLQNIHQTILFFMLLFYSVAQKHKMFCAICPNSSWQQTARHLCFGDLICTQWSTLLFCTLKFTNFAQPKCLQTEGSVSSDCHPVRQMEDVAVTWPFVSVLQFFTITNNQYGDFPTLLKHEKHLFWQIFLFKLQGFPSEQIKKKKKLIKMNKISIQIQLMTKYLGNLTNEDAIGGLLVPENGRGVRIGG